MSDLNDLVETLKREVAIPGAFEASFPNTTDDDLLGSLLDALAEAQLDGFLNHVSADEGGVTTPDISKAAGALITIYAGIRIVRNEIKNFDSHFRAESSGQVFERDKAASALTESLKDLRERKKGLQEIGKRGGTGTPVYTHDGYAIRSTSAFFPDELGHYSAGLLGASDYADDFGR